MPEPTTKTCSKCGEAKPLAAFYANTNGTHGRMPYCKKCDNARPRKVSAVRINRMRARHRAVADLIDLHEDEFETLLAIRLAEAHDEAERLAQTPEAAEHFKGEPVRLKPGKRMPGEKVGDRIDVARCPHCVKHHDRGHVCPRCGTAPAAGAGAPDGFNGQWVKRGGVMRPVVPTGPRVRDEGHLAAALADFNAGTRRAQEAKR